VDPAVPVADVAQAAADVDPAVPVADVAQAAADAAPAVPVADAALQVQAVLPRRSRPLPWLPLLRRLPYPTRRGPKGT
jgi:hypothetical protein